METVILMGAEDSLWQCFLIVTYFTTQRVFGLSFLFSSYLPFLPPLERDTISRTLARLSPLDHDNKEATVLTLMRGWSGGAVIWQGRYGPIALPTGNEPACWQRHDLTGQARASLLTSKILFPLRYD
jgi:hypothetical protein